MESKPNTVARIDYVVGEIIWAKIKGLFLFCLHTIWISNRFIIIPNIFSFPSKVFNVGQPGLKHSHRNEWFWSFGLMTIGPQKSIVRFKFLPHFDEFAQHFDKCVGLKCAAQEALITYGQLFSKLYDSWLNFFYANQTFDGNWLKSWKTHRLKKASLN